MKSFYIFVILLFTGVVSFGETRVGIFGDVHGDGEALSEVLEQFRKERVTHLLGLGDYVSVFRKAGESAASLRARSEPQLKYVLGMLENSGVGRERTFLKEGNWEKVNYEPLVQKYGHYLGPYYGREFVEIDGLKISVSHYPLHAPHLVPDEVIPSHVIEAHKESKPYDNALLGGQEKLSFPDPPDVRLKLFGHTHIAGSYRDPDSGALILNPGAVGGRRIEGEPRSYAILDREAESVTIYDVETHRPRQFESSPVHCINAFGAISN